MGESIKGTEAMNFDFNETERALCEKIKALFDLESRATLARLEKGDATEIREETLKWIQILGQAGYLTHGLDEGKNSVSLTKIQEGLASISPSLFVNVEVTARIFGRLVTVYGTRNQKDNIIPLLKEGRLIGAVALSEGGINIENDPLDTSAVSSGDGFHVSGSKGHVVNGPIADWIAVAGKIGEEVAFFLIKKGSEGIYIDQRLSTLGYNGTAISAIRLERCSVSSASIIGPLEG